MANENMTGNTISGSCLCGLVTLSMTPNRQVVACHCQQCRKQTGHFVAATRVENHQLHIEGGKELTWYKSSDNASRGFCKHCGSILFWRSDNSQHTSVMAGCLNAPTGLVIDRHIYVDDKGDYYDIGPEETSFSQADS